MDQKSIDQIEKIINTSLLEQEKRLEQKFATKSDLREVKDEIVDEIGSMIQDFGMTIDQKFAKKELVASLEARMVELERKVAP